jgi:hypothetical protein
MASANYSASQEPPPISEVLRMVVQEHRELRARYQDVTSRIRKLRNAVRMLRSLGVADDCADPAQETEHQHAIRRQARRDDPALRRACRIAVLETVEAVSNEEIYARIVRRGSFSFVNAGAAARAIAAELSSMAEQGELRRVDNATKWQRI